MMIDTPFETTGTVTGNSDGEQWLSDLAASNGRVSYQIVGQSQEGRDISLTLVTDDGRAYSRAAERPCVLIVGNQHGNEIAGRDAVLAGVRNLAFTEDATLLSLLSNYSVGFIFTANPDGFQFDQLGIADGRNLNRHHVDFQSPESVVLGAVVRDLEPVLMLDLHEDNTRSTQAMFSYGTHPDVDPAIAAEAVGFIEDWLFPAVNAAGYGFSFWVGGTDDNPNSLRNSSGLRGMLGILVESSRQSGVNTIAGRIEVHTIAVMQAMAYAAANLASLVALTTASRNGQRSAGLAGTPKGYEATNQQMVGTLRSRRLLGIQGHRHADGWVVPLNQRMRPLAEILVGSTFTNASTVPQPELRVVKAGQDEALVSGLRVGQSVVPITAIERTWRLA